MFLQYTEANSLVSIHNGSNESIHIIPNNDGDKEDIGWLFTIIMFRLSSESVNINPTLIYQISSNA